MLPTFSTSLQGKQCGDQYISFSLKRKHKISVAARTVTRDLRTSGFVSFEPLLPLHSSSMAPKAHFFGSTLLCLFKKRFAVLIHFCVARPTSTALSKTKNSFFFYGSATFKAKQFSNSHGLSVCVLPCSHEQGACWGRRAKHWIRRPCGVRLLVHDDKQLADGHGHMSKASEDGFQGNSVTSSLYFSILWRRVRGNQTGIEDTTTSG